MPKTATRHDEPPDEKAPRPEKPTPKGTGPHADDAEHTGAREDQVTDTPAPSGDAFKDEPKQG